VQSTVAIGSGVDRHWMGAAGGALVNGQYMGSGYGRWHGRWVGGTFNDSPQKLVFTHSQVTIL